MSQLARSDKSEQSYKSQIGRFKKPVFQSVLLMTLLLFDFGSVWAATLHKPSWSGTVIFVVDGDTLQVRPDDGGAPVSLRIEGIDAPEICQLGGIDSRDVLKQRTLGRSVSIFGQRHDTYGRFLAPVYLDGQDLGEWMVEEGQAWSYRYRKDTGPYSLQESRARTAMLGIFSDGTAVALEPRLFRKQHGTCYPQHR